MFEVGKGYMFKILEGGEHGPYETVQWYEVAAADGNLLKLLGPDFSKGKFAEFAPDEVRNSPREEIILNTSSAFFLSAAPARKADDE